MKNKYLYKTKEISSITGIDVKVINDRIEDKIFKEIYIDEEIYIDIREVNSWIMENKSYYNFSKINIIDHKNTSAREKNKKLKVIDLFCGAGGSSCGFHMAEFDIVAAIDINKKAIESHKRNFPDTISICDDISKFKPEEMEKLINEDVDVIIGSPPCQTFSSLSQGKIASLGRDIKKDIRNYYFKSYIDYVIHFKPKVFVMENVPGFMTKYKGAIFNEFCSFFEEYNNGEYQLTYKILNSEDYGVPQTRRRLFVVGYKKGYEFEWPKCTHNEEQGFVSVKDAIEDLPFISDDWRIDEMPYSSYTNLKPYQEIMRNGKETVKNNICRVSNDNAKEMFKHLLPGQRYLEIDEATRSKLDFIKSFKSDIISTRCRRLPMDEPSWTVIAHIGMDGYEYIHPWECRTLSVREAARLQSFPDDFIFIGNMREQYVQIGNAVPPLLAYSIAKEVHRTIDRK